MKLLWGLMGIYLLNISVDTADPNPHHLPEDLSFNDQESIVEVVVEKILGFEDAFREYDDQDSEDHNKKSNVKLDLVNRILADCVIAHLPDEVKIEKFPRFHECLLKGFHQLDTPPPKV